MDIKAIAERVAGDRLGYIVETYEFLNDAGEFAGLEGLGKGGTEIWYMKPSSFRDWSMGYDWLVEQGAIPALSLRQTHILLGKIACRDLHMIFKLMQGENWSPKLEASNLIRSKGLQHTSMSVGDVIGIGGRFWVVDIMGFKEI
jgi:hypothetical protein